MKMKNPAALLIAISIVAVVGCVAGDLTPEQRANLTPEARMWEVTDNYAIAQSAVLKYLRQDTCSATLVIGCKDLAVVNVLADADAHANTAITTAVKAVRASSVTCKADPATDVCLDELTLAAAASHAARAALASLSSHLIKTQATQ